MRQVGNDDAEDAPEEPEQAGGAGGGQEEEGAAGFGGLTEAELAQILWDQVRSFVIAQRKKALTLVPVSSCCWCRCSGCRRACLWHSSCASGAWARAAPTIPRSPPLPCPPHIPPHTRLASPPSAAGAVLGRAAPVHPGGQRAAARDCGAGGARNGQRAGGVHALDACCDMLCVSFTLLEYSLEAARRQACAAAAVAARRQLCRPALAAPCCSCRCRPRWKWETFAPSANGPCASCTCCTGATALAALPARRWHRLRRLAAAGAAQGRQAALAAGRQAGRKVQPPVLYACFHLTSPHFTSLARAACSTWCRRRC